MIRRAFWLTVGAVGGIMGYRRVAALGRRARAQSLTRDAIHATREIRSFSRDVREGMDLYSARRPRAVPPTLATAPPGGATPRTPRNDNDVHVKDDR